MSEDGGQALLQVARWAQGIPRGGGQVRQGGQLPGEEIPAGPGTCSLLGKGEKGVREGKAGNPRPLCFQSLLLLILSVNPKATEVAGGVRGC